LRTALTDEAVRLLLDNLAGRRFQPIGQLVDERCIVNAMVALLATGGSTNHLIHWVAVAAAAGIQINWDDFSDLSAVAPLLARVYPNGSADVNQFQAAGGPGFVIRELLDAGCMHETPAMALEGLRAHTREPWMNQGVLAWRDYAQASIDTGIVRSAAEPFSPTGGLKVLQGNLGRAVIKVSAVPDDRHVIEAPAKVFASQEAMLAAFKNGELERDVVVVVRFQGPQANGMPELHKLTPPLAVLQGRGFKVALVTDGRMSGASGKVPAAIHVSPEALAGGELAKVRDGDLIRVDAVQGVLTALVSETEWAAREVATLAADAELENGHGLGRELFAGMRRNVSSAESGGITWR
jgi:phosphogluconate dehydratase